MLIDDKKQLEFERMGRVSPTGNKTFGMPEPLEDANAPDPQSPRVFFRPCLPILCL